MNPFVTLHKQSIPLWIVFLINILLRTDLLFTDKQLLFCIDKPKLKTN